MKSLKYTAFVASILAAAFTAHAQTSDPVLKEGDKPAYSDFARANHIQGTVIVEALVDENGKVFAADVVQSVHADLDNAALAAVKNWKFTPAMEDGKATMQVVRVPLTFELVDPVKESLRSHDRAIVSRD